MASPIRQGKAPPAPGTPHIAVKSNQTQIRPCSTVFIAVFLHVLEMMTLRAAVMLDLLATGLHIYIYIYIFAVYIHVTCSFLDIEPE